jgi:hypothetical protein
MKVLLADNRPSADAYHADCSQDETQRKPGLHFTAHNPPPVTKAHFAQRHRESLISKLANQNCRRSKDKRQEQCEHQRLRQLLLIIGHCCCRQHFSEEQNHEPAGNAREAIKELTRVTK